MCVDVSASRLDYCGVIVLIITSHVPWFHFVFYCDHLAQFIYIGSFLVLGVMAVCFVLRDEFRRPSYRWIRFSKQQYSADDFPVDWLEGTTMKALVR